jgi:hypothetical protein
VSVFALAAKEIDVAWPLLETHIYRLERLGHIGADEIKEDLKQAKKQLWGYHVDGRIIGIAITRVTTTTCEIVAACGTSTAGGQIQELYERIERWARDSGRIRMRVIGRKGWLRVIAGYRQTGIVMEKDL